MKQEILSEVNRIHEIMGVINKNKENIFEAAGPPKSQVVEKFFELLGLSAEKDLDKSWEQLRNKVTSGTASAEEKEVESLIKDFLRSKPDIGAMSPQRFSQAVGKYGDELYEAFFKAEGVRAKFLEAFEKVNPAFSKVKEVLAQPVNFDKMYKMSDLKKWEGKMNTTIDNMSSVPDYLKPQLQEELAENYEKLSIELAEKNAQRVRLAESQLLELESYFGSIDSVQKVLDLSKEDATKFYEKFKQIDTLIKSSKKTIDDEQFLNRINDIKKAAKNISPSDLEKIKSKFKGGWPKFLQSRDGSVSWLKLGFYTFTACGVAGYALSLPLCEKIGYAFGWVLAKTFSGGKQGAQGAGEGVKSSGDVGQQQQQQQQQGQQQQQQQGQQQTEETIKTWLTAAANGDYGDAKWDIKKLGGIVYPDANGTNHATVLVDGQKWGITYNGTTWKWD